jgi:hypothetical protein
MLVDVELLPDDRDQNREDGAIQIIDGRGGEQERENPPAHARDYRIP